MSYVNTNFQIASTNFRQLLKQSVNNKQFEDRKC